MKKSIFVICIFALCVALNYNLQGAMKVTVTKDIPTTTSNITAQDNKIVEQIADQAIKVAAIQEESQANQPRLPWYKRAIQNIKKHWEKYALGAVGASAILILSTWLYKKDQEIKQLRQDLDQTKKIMPQSVQESIDKKQAIIDEQDRLEDERIELESKQRTAANEEELKKLNEKLEENRKKALDATDELNKKIVQQSREQQKSIEEAKEDLMVETNAIENMATKLKSDLKIGSGNVEESLRVLFREKKSAHDKNDKTKERAISALIGDLAKDNVDAFTEAAEKIKSEQKNK